MSLTDAEMPAVRPLTDSKKELVSLSPMPSGPRVASLAYSAPRMMTMPTTQRKNVVASTSLVSNVICRRRRRLSIMSEMTTKLMLPRMMRAAETSMNDASVWKPPKSSPSSRKPALLKAEMAWKKAFHRASGRG